MSASNRHLNRHLSKSKPGGIVGDARSFNEGERLLDSDGGEILRQGVKKKVNNRPFLHVGYCVHVDALKAFMSNHEIAFAEA